MALEVSSKLQFDLQNEGLESMRNTTCRQKFCGASSTITFTGIQTFACRMETDIERKTIENFPIIMQRGLRKSE